MTANPVKQKAPWLLGVLLLSQVVLMSMNARRPDSDQSVLRSWVMAGFTPLLKLGNLAVSTVTGAVDNYVELRGAREQKARLEDEVARLTEERDRLLELAAQADRERAQLALPSQPRYRTLASNVISRDVSLWFRRLIIDRGTTDGVALNMPVVTSTGVVGRVVSVGPNFAQVQVITDRHAGVGGTLQRSRSMGEVRGLDKGFCELKDIHASEDVQVGEAVVTNGLDGIYPKGLMIGTVESVENDPNAPWHRIIVKPAAPVDRLENVLVVLIEQKDLRMQETIK